MFFKFPLTHTHFRILQFCGFEIMHIYKLFNIQAKQMKKSFSCSLIPHNTLLVTHATYNHCLQNFLKISSFCHLGNSPINFLLLRMYIFIKKALQSFSSTKSNPWLQADPTCLELQWRMTYKIVMQSLKQSRYY